MRLIEQTAKLKSAKKNSFRQNLPQRWITGRKNKVSKEPIYHIAGRFGRHYPSLLTKWNPFIQASKA